MQNTNGMLVGLIGFGAMARALVHCLEENKGFDRIKIVSTLVQPNDLPVQPSASLSQTVFTTNPAEFFKRSPQLVVECAGHSAVRDVCPEVIGRGLDLILISIGALANPDLEAKLRGAAETSTGRLMLPGGPSVASISLRAPGLPVWRGFVIPRGSRHGPGKVPGRNRK